MDCSYGYEMTSAWTRFQLCEELESKGELDYLSYSNAGANLIKEFNKYNKESV